MTSYSLCSTTAFFMPQGAFQPGLVWLVYKCVIVLIAFLVEICAMLGQELITACEVHSVVVVMPGAAISFCHKVLFFLARLFRFLVL